MFSIHRYVIALYTVQVVLLPIFKEVQLVNWKHRGGLLANSARWNNYPYIVYHIVLHIFIIVIIIVGAMWMEVERINWLSRSETITVTKCTVKLVGTMRLCQSYQYAILLPLYTYSTCITVESGYMYNITIWYYDGRQTVRWLKKKQLKNSLNYSIILLV